MTPRVNLAAEPGLRDEIARVPPVFEQNPDGRSLYLLTCDHYGRLIPPSLRGLGIDEAQAKRHIAWDIGIAGVAERMSKALDAHLIAQRYSRLVIDCNRPFTAASSIPVLSEATAIPGNERLSDDEVKLRRELIFAPYHKRIARTLDARHAGGRPTVLLALHSFTPVYAGVARPWHIGTLYHRDDRLPKLLLAALRAEGDLVVGDNEPYAVSEESDYCIPVHAEPRGLVHTGIEIRQDLIGDAAGEAEWADRLSRIFSALQDELHPMLIR